MLDDDYRRLSHLPVAGHPRLPHRRRSSDVVAPVTLGRPGWQRRRARAANALDAGAVGCVPVFYLLWRDILPFPLFMAGLSGVVLSLVGRGALRAWMHHLRRHGWAMSSMLAVGTEADVAALVERTRRSPSLGWRIDGACTPTGTGPGGAPTISCAPVLGDLDSVASLALTRQFDAVSVSPAPGWTAVRLARLARDLDHSRTALMVDPRLTTHVGSWVQLRSVRGLPMRRLEHPAFRGVRRLIKELVDRFVAVLLLVVLAPVLMGCTVALRLERHAAFRRDVRIGLHGRPFLLLTFRCTEPATDMVTAVGRFMHRWCLDELPQLFNVLAGSMSLVGPRPLLPADTIAPLHRDLFVKPGMTGLWQLVDDDVVGEHAATADLRYVERWTPALDAWILLHTVRTVCSSALDR